MIVRTKIKKIIAERGMSQTELAKLSGVPQAFISRCDKSELHQMKNLVLIARALGVTIEDLLEIEEAAE